MAYIKKGRKIKCVDTGEYSTSNVAYKDKNNRYWSSEEAYRKWEENNELRKKTIALIFEVLGYATNMIVPGVLWKELKKFEPMGYETIYATVNGEREAVEWVLQNKVFSKEQDKIKYVCAIWRNKLIDYNKAIASLEKKNLNIDIPQDIVVENKRQGAKDISKFLED